MICLTGDVHHMMLHTDDQKYLDCTEVEAAVEYARIAAELNVKVTFFMTGKAVKEEYRIARKLLELPNVELGGHTYYAFRPKWLYNGVFKRMFGILNGPLAYQNYEIRKTIHTFKRLLGIRIVSWRDHSYRHDKNTYKLLAENGIRFVSDEVDPNKIKPYYKSGLISAPLNVLPDHDHIYHGDLDLEATKNWSLSRDKFSPNFYPIKSWLEIVKNQIIEIIADGGVATILAHPACMKITDNFESFKKFCRFIADYESVFIKDLEVNSSK